MGVPFVETAEIADLQKLLDWAKAKAPSSTMDDFGLVMPEGENPDVWANWIRHLNKNRTSRPSPDVFNTQLHNHEFDKVPEGWVYRE